MHTGLAGKVVVVTGAASGIGAATARLFAQEGARLALIDQDATALAALAEELPTETTWARADLSTRDGVITGIDEALDPFHGCVDILFNNVGAGSLGLFDTLTDRDWMATLELNFMSQVRAATHLLPRMRAQGHGVIINNASDLGRQPIIGGPDYAASKAAVLAFTTALAKSEGPAIRVNAVAAGATMSRMWSMAGGLADTFAGIHGVPREESIDVEMKARNLPLGRIGQPEEVANVVVFLASDLASYVTSSVYGVDGGSIGSIV